MWLTTSTRTERTPYIAAAQQLWSKQSPIHNAVQCTLKAVRSQKRKKGSGSTSTPWKVSISIVYFVIDDSPLLNFSTFPNTILLATYLCQWSDKQWEEAPDKWERKWDWFSHTWAVPPFYLLIAQFVLPLLYSILFRSYLSSISQLCTCVAE